MKIVVAAVVLTASVGFLAYAGMRKAQIHYLEVDTYLADARFAGQRVRLCGTVGQAGLEVNSATLTTRFNLLGRQGRVPVLYEGVLPDMFKAGADVVAEGRRDEAGVFRATSILTKCASKYKPADYADTTESVRGGSPTRRATVPPQAQVAGSDAAGQETRRATTARDADHQAAPERSP